jgi:hypothetical protein
MAHIIYYAVGLAIMAYGAWILIFKEGVLSSLEWLNSYATRKMVPPSNRVNFGHVALWLSFNTSSTLWMFCGLLVPSGGPVFVACAINLGVNYLISKLSGMVRIKVTLYKTILMVSAVSAYCLWVLAGSALHH